MVLFLPTFEYLPVQGTALLRRGETSVAYKPRFGCDSQARIRQLVWTS
jgi:hypothetical protein